MSLEKKKNYKKKPLRATLEIKIPESFSFAVDYIRGERGKSEWCGWHVESDSLGVARRSWTNEASNLTGFETNFSLDARKSEFFILIRS